MGYERYCSEKCEEFAHQIHREEYGISCLHCGQLFHAGGFERHRMNEFYRTREFPRGKRVSL